LISISYMNDIGGNVYVKNDKMNKS